MIKLEQRLADLSSFCTTCPPAQEVAALLAELGFHLTFSMPVIKYGNKTGQNVPDLPAQYHYEDDHNTEVIFLAGKDRSERDEPFYPQHASRWWIYAGSSQYSYNLVMQTLSTKYGLSWK